MAFRHRALRKGIYDATKVQRERVSVTLYIQHNKHLPATFSLSNEHVYAQISPPPRQTPCSSHASTVSITPRTRG